MFDTNIMKVISGPHTYSTLYVVQCNVDCLDLLKTGKYINTHACTEGVADNLLGVWRQFYRLISHGQNWLEGYPRNTSFLQAMHTHVHVHVNIHVYLYAFTIMPCSHRCVMYTRRQTFHTCTQGRVGSIVLLLFYNRHMLWCLRHLECFILYN